MNLTSCSLQATSRSPCMSLCLLKRLTVSASNCRSLTAKCRLYTETVRPTEVHHACCVPNDSEIESKTYVLDVHQSVPGNWRRIYTRVSAVADTQCISISLLARSELTDCQSRACLLRSTKRRTQTTQHSATSSVTSDIDNELHTSTHTERERERERDRQTDRERLCSVCDNDCNFNQIT